MGKKGPCFHCGIDYTPLWRNGPPAKPVLCNACGSRWRIWGTLDNYMPKHANASMVISHKDTGCQRGKLPLPIEVDDCRTSKDGAEAAGHGHYSTYSKDDGNDESGSGSTIFSTNTCIQLESINGNEASGSERPSFSNAQIPKGKRSVLKQRILSPTERLTRQLQGILQETEFSQLSTEPEDELIFQNNQRSSAEIVLGCVVLKSTAASKEYKSDHQCKL